LVAYRFLALALILAQSVVVTRVFGVEAFGVLSIAITIVAIVGMVGSLGLDQVMMRDLAALGPQNARTDSQFASLRRFAYRTVTPVVLLLVAVGAATFGFGAVDGTYRIGLMAAWLTLPVLMLRKFMEAAALGAKRPGLSFTGSNVVFPGVMIALGIAVPFAGVSADLVTLAWVYVVALCLSFVVLYLVARPQLGWVLSRTRGAEHFDQKQRRRTLGASVHLSLASAALVLGQNLDVLVSGLVSTPETVAVVRILSRLGEGVAVFRAMALLQYKPYLAEAGMNGDTGSLQSHMRSMGRIYVLTGLPILVASLMLAGPILSVYGAELDGYEDALRVYMTGVFVMLLGGPASAALTMSGHERLASRALWVAIGLSAVGNFALIPVLGAMGSAIASLTSSLVATGLCVYYARVHLRVRPWSLVTRKRRQSGVSDEMSRG
jgi:O-antigen/teichoic acid export membrane protein